MPNAQGQDQHHAQTNIKGKRTHRHAGIKGGKSIPIEPTLRNNETAAGRQNQHRTSEKVQRNHRKRGTAKAKGDTQDPTNPKP